jgi:hypothetical protein
MSKTARATLGTTGVFSKPAADVKAEPVATARPDREGRTAMPFWVPIAARKQLRMLAAELDTTNQNLMTVALNDLFEKHGKPRIA